MEGKTNKWGRFPTWVTREWNVAMNVPSSALNQEFATWNPNGLNSFMPDRSLLSWPRLADLHPVGGLCYQIPLPFHFPSIAALCPDGFPDSIPIPIISCYFSRFYHSLYYLMTQKPQPMCPSTPFYCIQVGIFSWMDFWYRPPNDFLLFTVCHFILIYFSEGSQCHLLNTWLSDQA